MPRLLLVSLIWAFSFGFVEWLAVDTGLGPSTLAAVRLWLAVPVFLACFRPGALSPGLAGRLALIGGIQYGVMYLCYFNAFRFLQAYEVALFTVFTPVYVSLIHDARARRFSLLNLLLALLAVAGALVIQYREAPPADVLAGFALMQLANAAFAFGQIEYKRLRAHNPGLQDRQVYALLFIAAALLASLAAALDGGLPAVTQLAPPQWAVLAYLGIVASGLCFFWWNQGAVQVAPASLAVLNNLKIPLAVAVSLIVFDNQTDIPRLLAGGGLMLAALFASERFAARRTRPAAS